jgi:hypothetical protein
MLSMKTIKKKFDIKLFFLPISLTLLLSGVSFAILDYHNARSLERRFENELLSIARTCEYIITSRQGMADKSYNDIESLGALTESRINIIDANGKVSGGLAALRKGDLVHGQPP